MIATPQHRLASLTVILATGLGMGRIPVAPGTFGSLWAFPIIWFLWQLPLAGQVTAIAALCWLGVGVCGAAARHLQLKDPACVVWDEFTTLPIVYLGCSSAEVQDPLLLAIGFGLFRLFDISKLPPGRQLERLPEGWGIMLDDVVAAVYGWGALWLVRAFVFR